MYSRPNHEVLTDFHNAMRVMEESQHLGLDDQAADELRRLLKRRIAQLEKEVERERNPGVQWISVDRAEKT